MAPILKDSEAPTTSETSSRPGSAASSDSATRPQPVALEVPVTVNGVRTVGVSDRREPFSESTKTVMVHGQGAVIKLQSALAPGQLLFLTNERTKKEVVCQVMKSKSHRNVSGYVELEFTEPAVGFWGMRFPSDRIGPGPQAAPEADRPAAANLSPAPSRPAPHKGEPAAPPSPPSSVAGKPPTPTSVLPKPVTPRSSGSSIVPAPMDSGSLLGTANAKPEWGVPVAPATASLGREEPLIEPWLKKREPVSPVPAEPPRVAPPVAKTERPAASQTPIRNFEGARPSEQAASLFAPSEAPWNPATVDLSTLAPFFEVKPVPAASPSATPPKAPASSDHETEEVKRHTMRLEQELSEMQFAEPANDAPAKPTTEPTSVSAEEPSLSLLQADPVHESPAQFLENPVASGTPGVLPEVPKLQEPLKVELPAPIPALESLDEAELEIPAWLAPLARHASAPSSTKELVLREKAKRIAEQPQLEDLMAPLAASTKEGKAADAHVPQFGSALPFEGVPKVKENAPNKSGNGMLFVALAAGTVLLAAAGWWYKNQQAGRVVARTSALPAPGASAASQNVETNGPKEAALATLLPAPNDRATAPAKPDTSNSNAPEDEAPESVTAVARNPHNASDSANRRTTVIVAESAEPAAVRTEKKTVLGEVHLGAPKISPKQTAQGSSEPDAGISLGEEASEGDANALGAELGASSKQPAAPAAPAVTGGQVKQARLISSVPPEYPALAKAQHVAGGVTIDALIDDHGRVTSMKVLSGPTLLQQPAMDALRHFKYEPATLDGKAVPMHLTVTLQFRLQQ